MESSINISIEWNRALLFAMLEIQMKAVLKNGLFLN